VTAPTFGTACSYCHGAHSGPCGAQRRDLGMSAVEAVEHGDWPAKALRWVYRLERDATFTAEDLCAAIGRPARPNSVGARLSALARSGLIVVDGYGTAERVERHASVLRRWRRT